MALAVSVSTFRFDRSAKITPIRSAPPCAAARASSTDVTPQTFARGRDSSVFSSSVPSKRALMAALGSADRISASPTKTQETRKPPSTSSATSAREETPLKEQMTAGAEPLADSQSRAILARRAVVDMSSWKVWRLRLLMPMHLEPTSRAMSISSSVWTSTRGSMPATRQSPIKAARSLTPRQATMSSRESAPEARASSTM
mmetsp:Transcript_31547/g.106242  ORF Transcript_31547/g.106242 Transcript_31547/m.106242 type:complete len:201 (-) Transcript_31547:594-1196(-)